MEPSSLEYSLRSDCLVALEQGGVGEAGAAYASVITVLDLGAGGRRLCRLRDFMCALQLPLPPAWLVCASRLVTGALHLHREDNSIAAFALLDGGSGNEVVTGSVRYGAHEKVQPGPWHCHKPDWCSRGAAVPSTW